ncbi:MAG: metal-dependent hydrolase [Candidatus Nanosalina sp. J07AB43]|nr:MAG: metal-dependent hydrolase [Candidatus Nanosalina sp. J07AB43]
MFQLKNLGVQLKSGKMDVISVNAGYFLGYSGKHIDYMKRPWKALLGSHEEQDNLMELVDIIESEDPDHVLIQEVDGGSLRSKFNAQHRKIIESLNRGFDRSFDCKYRGSLFPHLPLFRFMGNLILHSSGKVVNHRLDSGRKNLVQELKLDELSIFSLHLATFSSTIRRKQLQELEEIAKQREKFVLAGDLNLHKSEKEINRLENQLGQNVRSPGKTFPACDPNQRLDLVTASKDVNVLDLHGLGNRFSDHIPIKFSLELG